MGKFEMTEQAARDWARSPEVLAGIRAGVAALHAGRFRPWEEVASELGIDNPQSGKATME